MDEFIPGLEMHWAAPLGFKPKIGVVIPCLNHFEYTKKAFDSYLASLSRPEDHVLLIFDNHSQDGTCKFFTALKGELRNICYFRYKANRGVTQPWNDGLRYCLNVLRVEYVFLVNNDVIFTKHCLDRLVKCLDGARNGHLVGPVTNRPGVHEGQHIRNFLPAYVESDDSGSIERTSKAVARKHALAWDELNGFFFGGRAATFRMNVLQKVPLELYFDPRNFVLHNEREFQARLRKKGFRILLATNTFVFHYKGVTRELGPGVTWTPNANLKRATRALRMKKPGDDAGAMTRRDSMSRPRRKFEARILIGVCSCRRYSEKREAVRNTWMKRLPQRISAVFFVGAPSPAGNGKIRQRTWRSAKRLSSRQSSIERDVVSLGAPDDYHGLPKKVQAFFQYALTHYEFDYLFKCDDDTYVKPERLFDLLNGECEFVGSRDWWPSHADGGAGYLLSRQSVAIAANAVCPDSGPEDVWVTESLRKACIQLRASAQLQYDYMEPPLPHNRLITAHHCSPSLMTAIHAKLLDERSNRILMSFNATHAAWRGPLVLLENGFFLGGACRPHGYWRFGNQRKALVIDWFSWPTDRLRKTASGYANSKLRLEKAG